MKNDRSIKDFLKPKHNSKTVQGYFIPKNPKKYKGDITKIIYRSSWEFKFLEYCDNSDSVVEYSSEPIGIPYFNPITKKISKYWIDFYIMLKNKNGEIIKWLIEIKPNDYLKAPLPPKILTEKKTLNYVRQAKNYIINQAKFEAAKEYAKRNNMKFGIITENFLFKQL